MNAKRLRLILFAIPLVTVGALMVAADRSHPNAGVIDPVCSSSLACIEYDNNGSGPAIRGIGLNGQGMIGVTKHNSTSPSNGTSGVVGNDNSSSGTFNLGVNGFSALGVGVAGGSVNGTGVRGITSSGLGVSGKSTSGTGVVGTAAGGIGVFGNGNIGVEATDESGSGSATSRDVLLANGFGGRLFRANNSHGVDVFSISDFGIANAFAITAGSSAVGTGVNANGSFAGVQGSAASSTAFGVQGNNNGSASSIAVRANSFGGNEFVGNGSNGLDNFIVDNSGNVFAHSFSATLAAGLRTSSGPPLPTYTNEVKQPMLEDFGEATLSGGQAYVPLDPHFASALSHSQPYLVFLTPLGPTHGSLYVTQRTLNGFSVRENDYGHSTVAFDYRIVGRPYAVTMPPLQPSATILHGPKVQQPIPTFSKQPKQAIVPKR